MLSMTMFGWHASATLISVLSSLPASTLTLNTEQAVYAKLFFRCSFIALLAFVLPRLLYRGESGAGIPRHHAVRWLATAWLCFIVSDVTAVIFALDQPIVAVANTLGVIVCVAPLLCTMEFVNQASQEANRMINARALMQTMQTTLIEWHKLVNAQAQLTPQLSQKNSVELSLAALACCSVQATASDWYAVDIKQMPSANNILARYIAPVRSLFGLPSVIFRANNSDRVTGCENSLSSVAMSSSAKERMFSIIEQLLMESELEQPGQQTLQIVLVKNRKTDVVNQVKLAPAVGTTRPGILVDGQALTKSDRCQAKLSHSANQTTMAGKDTLPKRALFWFFGSALAVALCSGTYIASHEQSRTFSQILQDDTADSLLFLLALVRFCGILSRNITLGKPNKLRTGAM